MDGLRRLLKLTRYEVTAVEQLLLVKCLMTWDRWRLQEASPVVRVGEYQLQSSGSDEENAQLEVKRSSRDEAEEELVLEQASQEDVALPEGRHCDGVAALEAACPRNYGTLIKDYSEGDNTCALLSVPLSELLSNAK